MKKQVEVAVSHPLETFLDIEENSTIMTYTERVEDEAVSSIEYDDKDKEIESELTEIKKEALNAFDALIDEMHSVSDPRQKARLGEVSNQVLGTALAAVQQKMKIKQEKDKNSKRSRLPPGGKNIQNNIFMDRNEMLRKIADGSILIDGDSE